MKRMFWIVPIVTLAACAAPTTQRPNFSDAEYKAEQAQQAAAVKAAKKGSFDDQKTYSAAQLQALQARLSPIADRVEKASEAVCTDLAAKRCSFAVKFDPTEKGLNAHADGQQVVIYPAMVDFAKDDDQLAFVIAHEFAHSIMGHVASQQKNVLVGGILGTLGDVFAQSQGFDTGGQFGKLGANQALLRYSSQFESEADYVGLYILARAGYKIDDAPGFWRQMSLQVPQAVYTSTTHPNNPSRTIAMQKTVTEIHGKQANRQPLLPNIAPEK